MLGSHVNPITAFLPSISGEQPAGARAAELHVSSADAATLFPLQDRKEGAVHMLIHQALVHDVCQLIRHWFMMSL